MNDRHWVSSALALYATALVACSSGLPPEKATGDAGESSREDAGAANDGRGGNGTNDAGADSNPDAVPGGGEPNGSGGSSGGSAGAQAAGGSASNEQGGGPDEMGGGGFTIGAPSSDCEAGKPAAPEALAPVAGLTLPPSSGHECDSTYEPNDTSGQACQLVLGEKAATQLSTPDDKTDNFVFHAEAGVTYTLMVSALKCTGSPGGNYVYITAKSLATTGPTTQLNNKQLYFGTQASYEIESNVTADELVTVTGSQSCSYSLKVVPSTAQGLEHGADHEPNDTPSSGRRFALAERVASSLTAPSDTTDYFLVPVQANVTYSLHVSAEHCSPSNAWVSVTGDSLGSGAPVKNVGATSVYFGTVMNKEFTTITSGEELLAFTTSQSCEYEFYVLPSTVCGFEHGPDDEPNDTAAIAVPIALDEKTSGDLSKPGDLSDYYSFAVEPNTKYTLLLSAARCKGSNSLSTMSAEFWSGRTEKQPNASHQFGLGVGNTPFSFTTANSTQELLLISGGDPCVYDFTISKD
jgi:hypothetical protein